MTSLFKIGKLGMRQVPSTNNISRISMTGISLVMLFAISMTWDFPSRAREKTLI